VVDGAAARAPPQPSDAMGTERSVGGAGNSIMLSAKVEHGSGGIHAAKGEEMRPTESIPSGGTAVDETECCGTATSIANKRRRSLDGTCSPSEEREGEERERVDFENGEDGGGYCDGEGDGVEGELRGLSARGVSPEGGEGRRRKRKKRGEAKEGQGNDESRFKFVADEVGSTVM